MNLADSHFDFLGYRFKRSRQGRMLRLVRPKSLRKLRESIKPKMRRNNGRSMDAIVADLNRTLKGWYGYFKHVKPSQLGEIDGCVCAPFCASGGATGDVAGVRITIAGRTATSPGWGSFACWMPKPRKPPVSE